MLKNDNRYAILLKTLKYRSQHQLTNSYHQFEDEMLDPAEPLILMLNHSPAK